jgi:hypothetical protein
LNNSKAINKALGLGLSDAQISEFKEFSKFVEAATKIIKDRETSVSTSTDDALRKELDKYKSDYSNVTQENQTLVEKMGTIEKEFEAKFNQHVSQHGAKEYFLKMRASDKNVSQKTGVDYTLDLIEKEIFSTYIVSPNGELKAIDGTAATHPVKRDIVKTIDEIYEYYKEKAGILPLSNAGEDGNGTDGKPRTSSANSPEIDAQMQDLFNSRLGIR